MLKLHGEVNAVKNTTINTWRPRGDVEISTSPRGLGILYKTLLTRKFSKPDDGRYRPKHVVFYC